MKSREKLKSFWKISDHMTGCSKCKGKYRIRIWDIRVVFDINYDERTIYIVRAGYRGGVYK